MMDRAPGRAALRPEDLTHIELFLNGKPAGTATPSITRRRVHHAVPRQPRRAGHHRDRPPRLAAAHDDAPGTGTKISFVELAMFIGSDQGRSSGGPAR
jgi:hypothetical protein